MRVIEEKWEGKVIIITDYFTKNNRRTKKTTRS